ncbi:MAG: cytochrome c biogenesis protein CcsA [Limnochordia bacterium]|jgi:cytochrome c-type biogenesis protein CcmF
MGDLLLKGALIGGLGAALFWKLRWRLQARWAYYLHSVCIIAASLWLYYLIFTQQFSYAYVYQHTSTDLPWLYRLASFWAGQEGSFLLWTLWGAMIGLLLLPHGRPTPLMYYSLIQGALTAVLLVQSPFRILEVTPIQGAGLNPLLLNPWMAVHPPVVFLGYGVLAVPYVLALEVNHGQWARRVLPWSLFGWLTLGAGIFLGGYWAYGVLGWGGYWSWDPVENASLVPWLTGAALLHGLLWEKKWGRRLKLNRFLAVVTYLLVFYAAFITRSGLLADFSVHSFTAGGLNKILLTILAFLTLLPLVLLRNKEEEVPLGSKGDPWYPLAVYLLLGGAVLISIGTSAPMLTSLWGRPASLQPSFYNRVTFPIAVVLGFALGFSPLKSQGRASCVPGLLTLISCWWAYGQGVTKPLYLLFLGTFALVFFAHLFLWIGSLTQGLLYSGGHLAHIGLALLCIGIIFSIHAPQERFSLPLGGSMETFGYTFSYTGVGPRGERLIEVSNGQKSFLARPRIGLRGTAVPYIHRGMGADLFISPLNLIIEGGEYIQLGQGQQQALEDYTVALQALAMDHRQMRLGAQLAVSNDGWQGEVVPTWAPNGGGEMAYIEELDLAIALEGLDLQDQQVLLRLFHPETGPHQLVLEVSRKPFMSLLWSGAILIVVGGSIAWWRRVHLL